MKGITQLARCAWMGAAFCTMLRTTSAAPVQPIPPARPAATANIPAGKTVASVNGEAITWGQLEPVFKQAGPLPGNMPEAERREVYREALGSLIDDLLVTQFIRKYTPPASAAEIEKQMGELVAGLKKQNKTLPDLCRESHQTVAEIREDIAHDLQWNAYVDKRVTEADLQKYYAGYRDFFDKTTVRASHIFIKTSATTTPQDKAAAVMKLQQVRAQIMAGKLDFAAAARANSMCPSAPNGGDIGTFPRKYVVDENFARVAFSMKPGEVSDVVESSFGLHVIKVTERKQGQASDYNKIKGEIREFYMEDLKQGLLNQMRKDAKIEIFLP
jgi:peptidyl-prolyl cis-trans isomerase C